MAASWPMGPGQRAPAPAPEAPGLLRRRVLGRPVYGGVRLSRAAHDAQPLAQADLRPVGHRLAGGQRRQALAQAQAAAAVAAAPAVVPLSPSCLRLQRHLGGQLRAVIGRRQAAAAGRCLAPVLQLLEQMQRLVATALRWWRVGGRAGGQVGEMVWLEGQGGG